MKTAKIIIVGDPAVGKTTIITRYLRDLDNLEMVGETPYKPTVGASFSQVVKKIDGKEINFNIWDTAGGDQFDSLAPMYFRDAIGAFIVYDITSNDTFENIEAKWLGKVKEHASQECKIFILGNKVDKEAERQVSSEKLQEYASGKEFGCYEISAITGNNISIAFDGLFEEVANQTSQPFMETKSPVVNVTEPKNEKKNDCGC